MERNPPDCDPQSEVYVVLKWLNGWVGSWRKPNGKSAAFVITDLAAWQRAVAAVWLAADDPTDVSDVHIADVFGDRRPRTQRPPTRRQRQPTRKNSRWSESPCCGSNGRGTGRSSGRRRRSQRRQAVALRG
jgi:hypothetical protein